MAMIDTLNSKEVIDGIRRDCEHELNLNAAAAVVRQEWLELEGAMVYIHAVHSPKLTVLTIGVPLPETPPAVTHSFVEAQLILEEFYARTRAN
jgi:hypothetical protein